MTDAEEISSEDITAEGIGTSDFKPHLPLPYATKTLLVEKLTATASYATATLTLSEGESNWLASHDLFPYWITFEITVDNEDIFMSKHYEGFDIEVYRDVGDYLLRKSVNTLEKPPLINSMTPDTDWLWRKRFNLLGTRVLAAQTLTIAIKNCTEVSVDTIQAIIHTVLARAS